MPKINIYQDGDFADQPQNTRCEVGWVKGRTVRIAVTRIGVGFSPGDEYAMLPQATAKGMNLSYPGAATSTGSAFPEAPAQGLHPSYPAAVESGGPPPEADAAVRVDAWQGFHMDLSRQQINLLIRTLRGARDAAYGRDE